MMDQIIAFAGDVSVQVVGLLAGLSAIAAALYSIGRKLDAIDATLVTILTELRLHRKDNDKE